MSGDELKKWAIEVFGARGWQSKLAALLGVDRTTIWRQITNDAVSGPVAAAVRNWQKNGVQICEHCQKIVDPELASFVPSLSNPDVDGYICDDCAEDNY